MTSTFVDAVSGNIDAAEVKIEKTIQLSRSIGDTNSEALSHFMLSHMHGWAGRFQEGEEIGARGAALARAKGLTSVVLRTQYAQAIGCAGGGRYDTALQLLEDGLALAEKIGDEAFLPRYKNGLGWLYIETGNFDKGYDLSQAAAEMARQIRHASGTEMACFAEVNMGDTALDRGDLALAGEILGSVERVALSPETHTWMKWRYTIHVFLSRGRLELARGNVSAARDYAEMCLRHAKPTRSRKYIAGAWALLGDCARADLDWEAAETRYTTANTIARAISHNPQIWQSHAKLGELYRDTNRNELGRNNYAAAVQFIDWLRQSTQDEHLLTGLQNSPRMAEIRERFNAIDEN